MWPVVNSYYDMSYDKTSAAGTASETGGLVGDPRWHPRTNLSIDEEPAIAPETFTLNQNYPNPFNPVTTIQFSLPIDIGISINVYNMQGRFVETLVDKKMLAGYHSIIWNANSYSSGIYFMKMQAGSQIHTQKLMLVK
jgi:hypothetical protein